MKIKSYFCRNLRIGGERKSDFLRCHIPHGYSDDGVLLENAQSVIDEWNKIDRDEKHNYEYRLDIPEMESPMKFKTFMRRRIKGSGVRSAIDMVCAFNQWHFDEAGIPRDDDGMDAEHALYMVNRFNKDSTDYKFWLEIEETEP